MFGSAPKCKSLNRARSIRTIEKNPVSPRETCRVYGQPRVSSQCVVHSVAHIHTYAAMRHSMSNVHDSIKRTFTYTVRCDNTKLVQFYLFFLRIHLFWLIKYRLHRFELYVCARPPFPSSRECVCVCMETTRERAPLTLLSTTTISQYRIVRLPACAA